jgi:transcriptional regulator with XRE-family HTH domain
VKKPESQWNADTIRRARKARGLTQAELADGLGCRQQTISEWELGMYGPKNAYQQLLSMFFGAANPEPRTLNPESKDTIPAEFPPGV